MQHPDINSIEAFTRRSLPPAELLALSDHLAVCEACREQAASFFSAVDMAGIETSLVGRSMGMHLSEYEMDVAAEDEGLLDAEVRAHLGACHACRKTVQDLKLFAEPFLPLPAKQPVPAKKLVLWPVWSGLVAAGLVFAFVVHSQMPR
jgi:hypothetical protein